MVLKLSEIVKLRGDRGTVGPMILVVLKGSTGFVVLGIDIERPVEPMILVILTELKGGVEGIDVRFNTDGVRTVPVDRMIDEKLVRLASVGNVGEPETEVEMFNKVGIERLGTETLGVEGMEIFEVGVEMFDKVGNERLGTETLGVERMGILEIGVERLNERVAETSPPIETEKPELGRVGVGRAMWSK